MLEPGLAWPSGRGSRCSSTRACWMPWLRADLSRWAVGDPRHAGWAGLGGSTTRHASVCFVHIYTFYTYFRLTPTIEPLLPLKCRPSVSAFLPATYTVFATLPDLIFVDTVPATPPDLTLDTVPATHPELTLDTVSAPDDARPSGLHPALAAAHGRGSRSGIRMPALAAPPSSRSSCIPVALAALPCGSSSHCC